MDFPNTEIREITLSSRRQSQAVASLLAACGLRPEPGVERMFGIYDSDDRLCGCGGLHGNVIKGLAMAPELRGTGVAAGLVTKLLNAAFEAGYPMARVYTKPEYEPLFTSLGFTLVGRAPHAVMLESDGAPLRRYKAYLREHPADGVIVANANPLTLGHLYLIKEAASRCNRLAIIPLEDNEHNAFSCEARVAMLRAATDSMENVEVLGPTDYVISEHTFPSYFLKEDSEVARQQAALDLDIFCRHLAPALGAKKRFAGTEPTDLLTASYNEAMRAILPRHGLEMVEIPRLERDGVAVSASRVRKALEQGDLAAALTMTPVSDIPALLAFLAVRALRMELEAAPKPGLVDPQDAGSHTDMNYPLMLKGLLALRPYFLHLAHEAFTAPELAADSLRRHGLEGERMMLAATGGVNTHKGAVFALGLAVAAVARILGGHSSPPISEEIAALASGLRPADGTHGREVKQMHGLPGALDYARSGYPELFADWLPMLRSLPPGNESLLRVLLRIIGTLHDSNAIYRAGGEKAGQARRDALELLEDFSLEGMRRLNEDFKQCRLSHGGAADMLSLTIFLKSAEDAFSSRSTPSTPKAPKINN